VTAGDLGITAAEVEQNLSSVLQLCSEWGALTLIDEADLFLETRTTQEMARNSVVCVMLRLLEYHQGVLFLTSNRAHNVDPAVQSRITVFLKYEALDSAGRTAVWRNLLDALSEGHTACPEMLGRHLLNGRQIKNSLLLGKALAKARGEPISTMLLERVVQVVGNVELQGSTGTAAATERGLQSATLGPLQDPSSPASHARPATATMSESAHPQTPKIFSGGFSPDADRTVSPKISARQPLVGQASFPPLGTVSQMLGMEAGSTSARQAFPANAMGRSASISIDVLSLPLVSSTSSAGNSFTAMVPSAVPPGVSSTAGLPTTLPAPASPAVVARPAAVPAPLPASPAMVARPTAVPVPVATGHLSAIRPVAGPGMQLPVTTTLGAGPPLGSSSSAAALGWAGGYCGGQLAGYPPQSPNAGVRHLMPPVTGGSLSAPPPLLPGPGGPTMWHH